MIVNRRTYHLTPGGFTDVLNLMKEIKTLTKQEFDKDIKVLTAHYGPFNTIVLELEFENSGEQDAFSEQWYPRLFEKEFVTKVFDLVSTGTSELWHYDP